MEFTSILGRLALAALLGLLVGLQRERASQIAGLRTFALITLLGFLGGLLSSPLGGWPVGAGLVALAIVLVAGNLLERRQPAADPGVTTEVAALLMYGVGAYLAMGDPTVAVALGATIAALLAFKMEIHGAAQRLTESDVKAIVQFALLSLVILPALPDRPIGPYGVVSPRQVWWMVVLIVGLGLSGYIAHKFASDHASLTINGLLGGAVSSTATSVSYAQKVARGFIQPGSAAAVVLLASAVACVRIMLELAVTAPVLLWPAGTSLALMMLPLVAGGLILLRNTHSPAPMRDLTNPSQLKSAFLFAALYAGILIAVAAVKDRLGEGALYWLAVVSGLTDVDAITLSTARLVTTGVVDEGQGWRIIITAAASNLASKAAFVALLGGRSMLFKIAVPYAASLCAAAAMVLI